MKKIFRLFSILVSLSVCLVLFEPFAYSSNNDDAFAKQLEGGEAQPYLKTFTVSAYYSPLPCQSRYATGSYDGDIRLNGGGVRGADGSPVYPGMIAAPKSYAYGIKMHIPGVGIVAVHDRGGAIRESMGIPGIYDRLDVWMGYGDKGLQRALKWGKRTVDTLVYGQNDSIVEQISLTDYSPEEKNQCSNGYVEPVAVTVTPAVPQPVMITYLSSGSSGEAVKALQTELKRLNYFKEDITGNYGEVTEHAVFKFQQSQNLVGDLSSVGAGIFGPKTRDRLNEIIASRSYTSVIIAEATSAFRERTMYIAKELNYGMVDGDVKKLQLFLKEKGYFDGALTTDYFGPVTREALLEFQIANQIVQSESDQGAGHVGEKTLDVINRVWML